MNFFCTQVLNSAFGFFSLESSKYDNVDYIKEEILQQKLRTCLLQWGMDPKSCTNFLSHTNSDSLIRLFKMMGKEITGITKVSVSFPTNKQFCPKSGKLLTIEDDDIGKRNRHKNLPEAIYKISSKKTDIKLHNLFQISVHIIGKFTINNNKKFVNPELKIFFYFRKF